MKDISKLTKLFEHYAHTQSYSNAFSSMLEYFLIALRYYDTEEEQSIAITQLTSMKNKDQLIALITEIGELSEGFEDPLGELYQRVLSKGQNGQFFTPEPIATMMGKIALHDNMEGIENVLDPACGSGRMLLAAAKINRQLRFYGADIDPLCSKMALVNMLLNSLTGEIAHMDSLANAFYKGYKTGTILREGYHYPYYREFTNPEESYIWLRPTAQSTSNGFNSPFEPTKSPLMSEGSQGSLFDK